MNNINLKFAASPKNILAMYNVQGDPVLRFFIFKYVDSILPSKEEREAIVKENPNISKHELLRQWLENQTDEMIQAKLNNVSKTSPYVPSDIKLNVSAIVTAHGHLPGFAEIKKAYDSGNEQLAKELIINKANKEKYESFEKWYSNLSEKYDPLIVFIIMDAVFSASPSNKMNPPGIFFEKEAVDKISENIKESGKQETVPLLNIAKLYSSLTSQTKKQEASEFYTPVSDNSGWHYIPSKITSNSNQEKYGTFNSNVAKLMGFGSLAGWCVGGSERATSYLSEGDFYIYTVNNLPKVAIRLGGPGGKDLIELRGVNNDVVNIGPYWKEVFAFCSNRTDWKAGLESSEEWREVSTYRKYNSEIVNDSDKIKKIAEEFRLGNYSGAVYIEKDIFVKYPDLFESLVDGVLVGLESEKEIILAHHEISSFSDFIASEKHFPEIVKNNERIIKTIIDLIKTVNKLYNNEEDMIPRHFLLSKIWNKLPDSLKKSEDSIKKSFSKFVEANVSSYSLGKIDPSIMKIIKKDKKILEVIKNIVKSEICNDINYSILMGQQIDGGLFSSPRFILSCVLELMDEDKCFNRISSSFFLLNAKMIEILSGDDRILNKILPLYLDRAEKTVALERRLDGNIIGRIFPMLIAFRWELLPNKIKNHDVIKKIINIFTNYFRAESNSAKYAVAVSIGSVSPEVFSIILRENSDLFNVFKSGVETKISNSGNFYVFGPEKVNEFPKEILTNDFIKEFVIRKVSNSTSPIEQIHDFLSCADTSVVEPLKKDREFNDLIVPILAEAFTLKNKVQFNNAARFLSKWAYDNLPDEVKIIIKNNIIDIMLALLDQDENGIYSSFLGYPISDPYFWSDLKERIHPDVASKFITNGRYNKEGINLIKPFLIKQIELAHKEESVYRITGYFGIGSDELFEDNDITEAINKEIDYAIKHFPGDICTHASEQMAVLPSDIIDKIFGSIEKIVENEINIFFNQNFDFSEAAYRIYEIINKCSYSNISSKILKTKADDILKVLYKQMFKFISEKGMNSVQYANERFGSIMSRLGIDMKGEYSFENMFKSSFAINIITQSVLKNIKNSTKYFDGQSSEYGDIRNIMDFLKAPYFIVKDNDALIDSVVKKIKQPFITFLKNNSNKIDFVSLWSDSNPFINKLMNSSEVLKATKFIDMSDKIKKFLKDMDYSGYSRLQKLLRLYSLYERYGTPEMLNIMNDIIKEAGYENLESFWLTQLMQNNPCNLSGRVPSFASKIYPSLIPKYVSYINPHLWGVFVYTDAYAKATGINKESIKCIEKVLPGIANSAEFVALMKEIMDQIHANEQENQQQPQPQVEANVKTWYKIAKKKL